MVKRARSGITALFLAALALLAWRQWPAAPEPSAPVRTSGGRARPEEELPRIALERLDAERPESTSSGRDVFEYGRAPSPDPTPPPLSADAGDSGQPAPPTAPTASAGRPATPGLAVHYIGTVEQSGLRVAVLVSDDKKEVLTGREGDTVANRLRIVKIGIESVDVQDLGSDRVRRLPLKGN
jgi:hypothetical protein